MGELKTDDGAGGDAGDILIQDRDGVGVEFDEVLAVVCGDAEESGAPDLDLVIGLGGEPASGRVDAGIVMVGERAGGLAILEAGVEQIGPGGAN